MKYSSLCLTLLMLFAYLDKTFSQQESSQSLRNIEIQIEALGSEDPAERGAAMFAILSVGKDAADFLAQALADHPNEQVRANAVMALGYIPDNKTKDVLDWLLIGFADPSDAVRVATIKSTVNLNAAENLEEVRKMLSDPAPEVRKAAVKALASLRDMSSQESIIALLKDPLWDVDTAAAEALGVVGDSNAVDALRKVLSSHPVWAPRESAASALGNIKDPAAIGDLTKALKDPVASVRLAAMASLRKLHANDIADALADVLRDDPVWSVRKAVAEYLEDIGDADSLPALRDALNDPVASVRIAAVRALKSLNDPELAQDLSPVVAGDALWTVRLAAAEALADAGQIDDKTANSLARALKDPVTAVRKAAASVISKSGNKSIMDRVRQALQVEPDIGVKQILLETKGLQTLLKRLEKESSVSSFFPELRAEVLQKFALWEQIETGKQKLRDKAKALRRHIRQLARIRAPLETKVETKIDSIREGADKKEKAKLESKISQLDEEVLTRFEALSAKYPGTELLRELRGLVIAYLFLTREDDSVADMAQEIWIDLPAKSILLETADVAMSINKGEIARDLYVKVAKSVELDQDGVKRLRAIARKLHDGKYDAQAIGIYERIVNEAPEGKQGIDILRSAAEGFVEIEKYAKAIAVYRKIMKDFPDTNDATEATFSVIRLYAFKLNSPDIAIQLCEELIDKHPDESVRAHAKLLIAENHYLGKQYDKAISALGTSMGEFDENGKGVEARLILALCYMGKSDNHSAIQLLRDAVKRYPGDKLAAKAQFFIGYCYLTQQKCSEAMVEYQKVVDKYPESPYAQQARSFVRSFRKARRPNAAP